MEDALIKRPIAEIPEGEFPSTQFELRATREDEVKVVTEFLASIFQSPANARFISPEIFYWKYFTSRPDWDKPRSYVLQQGDVIIAHIGVWPVRFQIAGELRTGVQALDWAASPQHPGAGSRLRGVMEELADFQIGIGGTEAAQKTRVKLGFQPWGTITTYLRVVRPWLKFQKVIAGSPLRRGARLLRDTFRTRIPQIPVGAGWSAEVVACLDKSLNSALSVVQPGEFRSYRNAELLNYLGACPQSNARGLVFRYQHSICGYALLTRVEGQARIACLWVSQGWDVAYRLATEIAAQDPEAYEVVAEVSAPLEAEVLLKTGYRVYAAASTAIKDAKGTLPSGLTPCLQMTDSDAFFL